MNACWIGCISPGTVRPSTVSIACPSAWAASMTSADTSLPSTSTAAAPVSPVSEPYRTL